MKELCNNMHVKVMSYSKTGYASELLADKLVLGMSETPSSLVVQVLYHKI